MRNISFFFVFLFALNSSVFAVPWLGLAFKQEPYKNQVALKVKSIHPTADAAHVKAGDLIIAINGKTLTDMSVAKSALSDAKTGSIVSLKMIRDGKTVNAKIKMTERPDDVSQMTGSAIGSKFVAFEKNYYRNAEKSQKKPKARILDFWATWCGPCRKTLPILAKLYEKYQAQGLEVIGVSTEQLSVLEQFYKEFPSPYPLYRDATQELTRTYNITSVPTLILLDENGYIQKIWPGVPYEISLENAVREALK